MTPEESRLSATLPDYDVALSMTCECPRGGEVVAMRHADGAQMNDRTSPWVFVDHLRNDERGGVVTHQPCPGSGKNEWEAEHTL